MRQLPNSGLDPIVSVPFSKREPAEQDASFGMNENGRGAEPRRPSLLGAGAGVDFTSGSKGAGREVLRHHAEKETYREPGVLGRLGTTSFRTDLDHVGSVGSADLVECDGRDGWIELIAELRSVCR
ncbi:hypothetical protein FRC08_016094 [Ceratobasidium sp. 394]|nr:hypothetical protein FRC08_016094 [Ceratobasidium sp. 394]